MGFRLLILIFLVNRVFSQVSAPDVRCLEVLPNYNVRITWIPPADPTNQFYAYEIYSSNTSAGPFNLLTTLTGAINTNTFIDAGTTASIQSVYYYLVTRWGALGANSSKQSDTLQTISLNLLNITGQPYLDIRYNNLHKPALASTAANFILTKEYPPGITNIISVSPLLSVHDTLSVCTATIAYQVTLSDNLGCVSKSNLLKGVYNDTKQPNEPYIDSISVLPNGNTIIAWRVPYDKDVIEYEVQRLNPSGQRDTEASVIGRLKTSYTYTSTAANSGPVSLYIKAIDSCAKSSTLNYDVSTMFLKTKYNRCAYSTELNWNAYPSMPKGIKHYRIYYSANGGTYQLIGTTTLTSFTHTMPDPGKTLTYFIRVVNTDLSITASSNRVAFFAAQVNSPQYTYIKNVDVIDNQSTAINLLLDTSEYCNGIDLMQSYDGINFNSIGFLPNNGTPNYQFIDKTIEPAVRSYFYKAVLRDSCGNPRVISNVCKSILLKVMQDKEQLFTQHLSWSAYEGFAGKIQKYEVYRIINGLESETAIGSTNDTILRFTDNVEEEASKGSRIEYMVKAIEANNNPYKISSVSISNKVPVYIEDQIYVPNALAPNGYNRTWLPVTHFVDKYDYHVRIFNRWGKLFFETSSDTEAWDGGNEPAGIYVYLIDYKNARGEYKELKGTILLLR